MNCEYCGKEEALPFVCNYCGGIYCSDHRLPESHQCKGDLTQKRTIVAPQTTTFSWSDAPYTPPVPQPGNRFSAVEVRDIVIAWLALGFAFFLSFSGGVAGISSQSLRPESALPTLAISLTTIGSGFILHEMSHKFTARMYGHWAEFRMWPLGLVLALVTSLIGFIFAAPGATYISGQNITQEENGKISLAGPLVNVAVSTFFFSVFLTTGGFWSTLGLYGSYFNAFLAIFNLIPLGPLDGAKVFRWSKLIWAGVFLPILAVFLFVFII